MDSMAHYVLPKKGRHNNRGIRFALKDFLLSFPFRPLLGVVFVLEVARSYQGGGKSHSDAKQHSNMKDIKWGIVASSPCAFTFYLWISGTPISLRSRLSQLFPPLFC
jgi:hypothetical protein